MKLQKLPIITFILVLIASVITRYLQCLIDIDYVTGFFKDSSSLTSKLLYYIFILAIILFLIIAIITKNAKINFFRKKMVKMTKNECMVMGVLFIFVGVAVIIKTISYLTHKTNIYIILTSLIAVAALFFIGSSLIVSRRVRMSAGYIMIFVAFYYAVRSVYIFSNNNIIMSMSGELIRLMVSLLLGFFFLYIGRIFSRNETKGTRLKAYVFGYMAALLTLTEVISKFIYWFTSTDLNRKAITAENSRFLFPDVMFIAEGVLVLYILVALGRKSNKKEKALE